MNHRAIIVSHTHWDREWFLTYQQFRMSLVEMMGALLNLLSKDPGFKHFVLDGQTVMLDDYLEVRPERREELSKHVQEGRIAIGPWYTLPDEVLVSGESLIRNLLAGDRSARSFGACMRVAYLPDTFGHVSQMPQIVTGWGLRAAVISRGVPDSPNEFRWLAPDGSATLAINLRQRYSNALWLYPGEDLVPRIEKLIDSLSPHAATPYLLFLNGGDHAQPEASLPAAVHDISLAMPDLEVTQGSLDQFVDGVLAAQPVLEQRHGEMRDNRMHPIFPGVLSARIAVKQRNASCQRLLERWAEPIAAWVSDIGAADHRPVLHQAWRYLLQNHAHDSICGCSIDSVYEDMAVRFNWVEQIGSRLVGEGLRAIVQDFWTFDPDQPWSVVVFNSESGPRTDLVEATLELPLESDALVLYDEEEERDVPVDILRREAQPPTTFTIGSTETRLLLSRIAQGRLFQKVVLQAALVMLEDIVELQFVLGNVGHPDLARLGEFVETVTSYMEVEPEYRFHFHIKYSLTLDVRFIARNVPAMGYKVLRLAPAGHGQRLENTQPESTTIANDFFRVRVNARSGTLEVHDELTGRTLTGINRFVDQGDAGDTYNYAPPKGGHFCVDSPAAPPEIRVERSAIAQHLILKMNYQVPAQLDANGEARSAQLVELPVETRVSLSRHIRRVDIETTIDNRAKDHRLRVHFPTGMQEPEVWADSAFDVVTRSIQPPAATPATREAPVVHWPLQRFVDVGDGASGVMVVSDGLPEYEIIDGKEGQTIALTLLRCVGWLSRDNLKTRSGNAGPQIPTPEAQCLGQHTFQYALIPHAGTWEQAFLHAHQFVTPMRAIEVPAGFPRSLSGSLVQAQPAEVIVSAVKQPEEGPGLIVRVFNPLDEPVELALKLGIQFRTGELTTLREAVDPEEQTATGAQFRPPGHFKMRLRPKRIQTILFK